MRSNILFHLAIFLLSLEVYSQDSQIKSIHEIGFRPGFIQIKDGFNYGLVNSGINLNGAYRYTSHRSATILQFETAAGFGTNFRKGIGIMLSLKPYDFFYGFRGHYSPDFAIALGPYTSANFHWQVYPELQSGHLFWKSTYELGAKCIITLPVFDRMYRISFSAALLSLGSRPESTKEQYYYSMTLNDFAVNPHTNMLPGSIGRMNHLELEVEMLRPENKLNLSYSLEYSDYNVPPYYQNLIHSINMTWKIRTLSIPQK